MEAEMYGIGFITRKSSDKRLYRLYVDNLNVPVNGYYRSEKKAFNEGVELLKKKGKSETLKAYNYALNKKVRARFWNDKRIKALFKGFFGFELGKVLDKFIYGYTGNYGIDAVYFDKLIKTPDGLSTYDYIEKCYGNKAVKLIKKLL